MTTGFSKSLPASSHLLYSQGQSLSSPVPISPQSGSSSWFPLFSKLPIELQTKIWQDALSPRLVELRHVPEELAIRIKKHLTLATGPISLLQVCQYSRNIALKTYTLRFPRYSFVPAYFDDFRDVFLLDGLYALEYMLYSAGGSECFDDVRYIAIDPTYPLNTDPGVSVISTRSRSHRTTNDITNEGVSSLARAIKCFQSLQELFVLYPVSHGDEVPEWFVSNLHDLLEGEAQNLELEPHDFPIITCLSYDFHKEKVGRSEAVREWIEFGGY